MLQPYTTSSSFDPSQIAQEWTVFDTLTTKQKTELYKLTKENSIADAVADAVDVAFKALSDDRKNAIGIAIGMHSRWEDNGTSEGKFKGAYKIFHSLIQNCSKKSIPLSQVELVAFHYLKKTGERIPELNSDLSKHLITEQLNVRGKLQLTSKSFANLYASCLVDQILNGTNVGELGFDTIEKLIKFLPPKTRAIITQLCVPDTFIFDKKDAEVEQKGFYQAIHPEYDPKIAIPFFFEISPEKMKKISNTFTTLKSISFRKSEGNEHCLAMKIKNPGYKLDLESLKFFPNLFYLEIDSDKETDLTPLSHSPEINELQLIDRQGLVKGYDQLSESQVSHLRMSRCVDYQFLLGIPKLTSFEILRGDFNQNKSTIPPDIVKKLVDKRVRVLEVYSGQLSQKPSTQ